MQEDGWIRDTVEFVEICQGRSLSTDGKAGEIGTWPNDVEGSALY